jgi:hypothetical protein
MTIIRPRRIVRKLWSSHDPITIAITGGFRRNGRTILIVVILIEDISLKCGVIRMI